MISTPAESPSAVLHEGGRAKFSEEGKSYLVAALSDRFAILTKPFALRGTYIYAVVDLKKWTRGPLISARKNYDLRKPEDLKAAISDLDSGEARIAEHLSIPVSLTWTRKP